jgi:hypothetical protein
MVVVLFFVVICKLSISNYISISSSLLFFALFLSISIFSQFFCCLYISSYFFLFLHIFYSAVNPMNYDLL